ncbi:MAG: HD-GYP domain-containing protein [Phycisphaerae bacterium]
MTAPRTTDATSPPAAGRRAADAPTAAPAATGPVEPVEPVDPVKCLAVLRERLRRLTPADLTGRADGTAALSVDALLADLAAGLERLTLEHAGMADELLSAYEQLGIIFDMTRKIAGVHGESRVIELFVERLQQSFACRAVFVDDPHDGADGATGGNSRRFEPWIKAAIRRARAQGRVLVESASDGPPARPETFHEVMVAPVIAGDEFVCAIVLAADGGNDRFKSSDMMLLESLAAFCGDLIRNLRLTHEVREMSLSMVRALVNAVDQKDEYTSGHSVRVGYYATRLGRAVGLSRDDLEMLSWSALLHDVGKIGIRDDVLKKEGKLTAEEFDHIKEHPVRSYQVVQQVPQLAGALDGVLHHHERFSGKGYPAGLTGEAIPLQARIIQIADIFDALTSSRSYRSAFDWRKALSILKSEAAETVDPDLQPVFDRLIRERVEKDPDGWDRMVREANRFTQLSGHDGSA